MSKYKTLLELLNKLRPMDLPLKAELYDNIIDIENQVNNSSQIKLQVIPKIDEYDKKYHELLLAVKVKDPNETRHETALRYIRNADKEAPVIYSKTAEDHF